MDESCIPEAYRQLIEIREPVFAGKGIFAKQLLPKGVRILAESSCFSWENHCGYPRWDHVEDLYYAMDPQQRKAYNKLYYLDRMAPESAYSGLDPQNIIPRFMVGIFYTNKFKNAMLLAGSHFRHSCCPNVFTTEELLDNGQQVFHAIRDIQAGEELTISYINVRKTRAQRQKCLDEYEWTCHCFMCTLPKEGARVDKLLEECFKHQESQLRGLDTQEEPYWAKYYEVMKSQIESFKALGWGVEEVHRLSKGCIRACASWGKWQEALEWATKVVEMRRVMSGLDHPLFLEESHIMRYLAAKSKGGKNLTGEVMSDSEFKITIREYWFLLSDPDTNGE